MLYAAIIAMKDGTREKCLSHCDSWEVAQETVKHLCDREEYDFRAILVREANAEERAFVARATAAI